MQEGLVHSASDPRVARAAQRIVSARKDMEMSQSRVMHVCSRGRCRPMSETDAQCSLPCVAPNVYVCRLGCVHVCSPHACELYLDTPTQTCPVSGIQHGQLTSSYIKDDPRTWYTTTQAPVQRPKKKQRNLPPTRTTPAKRLQAVSHAQVLEQAKSMVELLLFSKSRSARNEKALSRMRSDAALQCEEYIKRVRRDQQLPYATDVYRIYGTIMAQPLPLTTLPYDDEKVGYYVAVICQMWQRIMKYLDTAHAPRTNRMTGCDVQTVALGTLYSMREGKKHQGHVMLPRDEFLSQHLPNISDLGTYFHIRRKNITKGKDMVTLALEHALRVNGHAALDARGVDVIQVAERLEEAQAHSRVPVKVSSSGEILFMPQSRRAK